MILYDLKCPAGHVFETWFRDSGAFETMRLHDAIVCPVCGETGVIKAPMAPPISRRSGTARRPSPQAPAQADGHGALRKALTKLRREIERNCDYVGEQFPEEVRKIHYGEVEERAIYGEASEDEFHALLEEGVEVRRVPLPRWRHNS